MARNVTNPGATPGGGHGQNPQNPRGGNRGSNNQTAQPKVEIRVRQSKPYILKNDICRFWIRVVIFSQRKPDSGREVFLEEETSLISHDVTDNAGEVYFEIQENITDEEQIKEVYIRLPDTDDEKKISLKIPPKKKAKITEKSFKIKVSSVIDQASGRCLLTFECHVFADDKPLAKEMVALKVGVVDLDKKPTDKTGQVTFHDRVALTSVEQIATYRFCLINFLDEEEVNVTIPAQEKKKKEDNDPETLELMSYSAGDGNFKIKVRITKSKGIGLDSIPFSIWQNGRNYRYRTNDQGEFVYILPGTLCEGEERHVIASCSGIEDSAKVTLRRKRPFVKTFAERRCRLVWILTIILWVIAIAIGPGKPLLNPDMFRGKDGLSSAEKLYNETSTKAYGTESFVIKPKDDGINTWKGIADYGQKAVWLFATIILVFAIILLVIVIARAVTYRSEEAIEELMHRSYGKADDPMFEKLAKYVGAYSIVKKQAGVQVSTSPSDYTAPAAPAAQPISHPAFGQNPILSFIGLDLLMEITLGIIKKIFFNK